MSATVDELVLFKPHYRSRAVPPELAGTHRVLERWAVSIGDCLYGIYWDEQPRTRFTPLDDQTAIVVDQLILRSPPMTRKFVEIWYRSGDPIANIARRLHIRRERIDERWYLVLGYFRGWFLESPVSTLRRLAATDPVSGKIDVAN